MFRRLQVAEKPMIHRKEYEYKRDFPGLFQKKSKSPKSPTCCHKGTVSRSATFTQPANVSSRRSYDSYQLDVVDFANGYRPFKVLEVASMNDLYRLVNGTERDMIRFNTRHDMDSSVLSSLTSSKHNDIDRIHCTLVFQLYKNMIKYVMYRNSYRVSAGLKPRARLSRRTCSPLPCTRVSRSPDRDRPMNFDLHGRIPARLRVSQSGITHHSV